MYKKLGLNFLKDNDAELSFLADCLSFKKFIPKNPVLSDKVFFLLIEKIDVNVFSDTFFLFLLKKFKIWLMFSLKVTRHELVVQECKFG